jgi:hypothetical protein
VDIVFQYTTPDERSTLFARMLHRLDVGGPLIIQGYKPRQLVFNTGGPGKLAHLNDVALMLDALGELDILDLRT